MAPRLVVEDSEQRKRIVASTHDGSHLGLNRTNDMIASKYYWPGLFTDVKTYVSFTSLHCSSSSNNIYIPHNQVESCDHCQRGNRS